MIPGLIIDPEDVGISSTIIHGPTSTTTNLTEQYQPESVLQSSEDSGIFARSGDNHRRIVRNNDIESVEENSPLLCSLDDSAINVHIPEKNAISFFQALKIPVSFFLKQKKF
ncbi:hypothetical protein BLA29_011386 [Euroglyphus maynei]|uniref:Uncharacterized protein n=1 Tax=Euroglyphus maynei TaxID=6958 RepID=A0A1Y3AXQ4_EURMA|nr:hypothetical protein BLA29_011386 [Euroglyphus maynei]